MNQKVILILSDGLKTQSVKECKHEFATKCMTNFPMIDAQTVMPSVTLPCHMSLFLSVPPMRHGILTNTYTPQVRPVNSLINVLRDHGKTAAMFYNWEELRDISRPGALNYSLYTELTPDFKSDYFLTDSAIAYGLEKSPDFIFLYLGTTDCVGHQYGWESEEYVSSVEHNFACIEKVYQALSKDYHIIVTADHGGHDRCHGTDLPEDMNIPILLISDQIKTLKQANRDISILDIAPTITDLIGIPSDKDWEGESFVE